MNSHALARHHGSKSLDEHFEGLDEIFEGLPPKYGGVALLHNGVVSPEVERKLKSGARLTVLNVGDDPSAPASVSGRPSEE